MKFVGNTTNGAASGETVFRRRRIHNLRQKDRRVTMIGYSICLLRLENSNLFYFYRKNLYRSGCYGNKACSR